jgi:hypothetical protein
MRKFVNTLTDIAGKANVVIEGGKMKGKGAGRSAPVAPAPQQDQLSMFGAQRRLHMGNAAYRAYCRRLMTTGRTQAIRNQAREEFLHNAPGIGSQSSSSGSSSGNDSDNESVISADEPSSSSSSGSSAGGLNIDFDDLKWGSFTKQFERFKHTNPKAPIHDLEGFARHIVADPKHYNKTTLKRARFYLNVLLKSHHNKMKGKGLDDHLPSANKDDRQTLWKAGSSNNEMFGPHKGGVRVDMKGSGMGTYSGPAIGSSRTGTIPYAPTPYFSHQTMAGGSIHTHHHHYYHPMSGMGVFDSLDPRLNGVADAFDPRSNGVMSSVENLVNTGKSAATNAIGKLKSSVRPGIKKTVSAGIDELSGMPGTGSLVGMLGLNNAIDQGVSKLNLGLGLKKPHMVKGSAEAKEHMAKMRAMRGKK